MVRADTFIRRSGALIALAVVAGCPSENTSDKTADGFVDAYYVEFDFDQALTFTTGAATRRIEAEQELAREGRERGTIEAAKARVYYDQPEHRQVGDDAAHHTYNLEVHQGSVVFRREVFVMTALRKGRWQVISFREERGPAAGSGTPRGTGVRTATRSQP